MEEEVMRLMREGYSCGQIVVKLVGLDPVEKENDDIIKAMDGMTYGLGCQYTCGSLIGGAAALAMYADTKEAKNNMINKLCSWFEHKYGGDTCADILGRGNPASGACPILVTETVEKCFEILEEML